MPTTEQNKIIREMVALTDDLIDNFEGDIPAIQRKMLNRIVTLSKDLATDAQGNIKPTAKNLALIKRISSDLSDIVLSPKYINGVDKFVNGFNRTRKKINNYFRTIFSDFKVKGLYNAITQTSIDETLERLVGAGIDAELIEPIERIISENISLGAPFGDYVEQLRGELLGVGGKLGTLDRYVKQITTDSINQFNSVYMQNVGNDLGLNTWYFYEGSRIKNTRDFCIRRHGKYFHRKEVEKWASLQWAGKIAATTKSTIFVFRGGWNCRHFILPVMQEVVPQSVISRNITNGNFTPTED